VALRDRARLEKDLLQSGRLEIAVFRVLRREWRLEKCILARITARIEQRLAKRIGLGARRGRLRRLHEEDEEQRILVVGWPALDRLQMREARRLELVLDDRWRNAVATAIGG